MKITRYEHACMVLEKSEERLVIDPGSFTRSLADLDRVAAVVITHEHADHWTPEHLAAIRAANPGVRMLGPDGVKLAVADQPIEPVRAGDVVEVGSWRLEFFGEKHAVIHASIPVIDNVGVLVDDAFYYGGDSYTAPGRPVELLAAPTGAPWLKIGDVIDYVLEVAPRRSIAVHDRPLSEDVGIPMQHARIKWATEQGGGTFVPLAPGDALTL